VLWNLRRVLGAILPGLGKKVEFVKNKSSMYVLQFLADPACGAEPSKSLSVEYRLLCSGTVYRNIIGDWSKSEASRFLLAPPLMLYAASRPIYEYPLELLLRFKVAQQKKTAQGMGGSTISSIFHPDAEVAQDLAALLTLLCRRLMTVSGKSQEEHADYQYPEFGHVPFPVATSLRRIYWPPLPATVITSISSQEVHDNNPPPLSVDPQALTALLTALPSSQYAESIVASARLYALALELIRDQPDISYQLLISAVETLANEALNSFQPDDDEKVEHQRTVFNLMKDLGIGDDIARQVAIAACKREHWATRKFKKFLKDNIDSSIWEKEDDLFKTLPNSVPLRDQFEKTLGKIYDARSKATHFGQQFPISAAYAGGPMIPAAITTSLLSADPIFPPVVWFERLVNKAITRFWQSSVSAVLTPPSSESDEKRV
jgi:hypothetical protein